MIYSYKECATIVILQCALTLCNHLKGTCTAMKCWWVLLGTIFFIKSLTNICSILSCSHFFLYVGMTMVYPEVVILSWLTNPMTPLFYMTTLAMSKLLSQPTIKSPIVLNSAAYFHLLKGGQTRLSCQAFLLSSTSAGIRRDHGKAIERLGGKHYVEKLLPKPVRA